MRADALGVKVASVFSAFIATVPGTSLPVASLSVTVACVPACDELIDAGSIAWAKGRVTCVPVTTLSALLVLVETVAALSLVSAAAMGPPSPPPPHPATSAASMTALRLIGGLTDLTKLFITFPSVFWVRTVRLCGRSVVDSAPGALVKGFVVDTFCDVGESLVTLLSKSESDQPARSSFVAAGLSRRSMSASARSLA